MNTTETTTPGASINPVTGAAFTNPATGRLVAPGTVIGHRKNGAPIYLQAGGSQPAGEPAGAPAGGTGQAPGTTTVSSTSDSTGGIVVTEVSGQAPPADGLRTAGVADPNSTFANPAAQQPATPPQTPPAQPPAGQPAGEGIEALPDWAQKEIKQARKGEAAKREAAKQATEAATLAEQKHQELLGNLAKVLGLAPEQGEKEVDPAQLTKELQASQLEARETRIELAVYRAAAKHGGDPDALLDSRGFAAKALALDPKADDFQDKLTAVIKAAVEENPKLALKAPETTTPPPAGGGGFPSAGPSGGSFAGGPTAGDDVESLSVDDFRKRRRNR